MTSQNLAVVMEPNVLRKKIYDLEGIKGNE